MQYRKQNHTTSRMGTGHRKQHAAQRARQHTRRAPQRPAAHNGKTILWLLLFFPVGLTKMWRDSCTWKPIVKYALSAVPLLALICLFVLPLQVISGEGSVELVGNEKTAEIYGPEAPAVISDSYVKPVNGTVIIEEEASESNTLYVYATKKQTHYHRYTCKYAFASGMRLTVYEAEMLGLTPCKVCDPPTYAEIQAEEAAAEAGITENTENTETIPGVHEAESVQ